MLDDSPARARHILCHVYFNEQLHGDLFGQLDSLVAALVHGSRFRALAEVEER